MAGITTMHPAYPGGHVEVNREYLESDWYWRKIITNNMDIGVI
jgi:hypothetical protein